MKTFFLFLKYLPFLLLFYIWKKKFLTLLVSAEAWQSSTNSCSHSLNKSDLHINPQFMNCNRAAVTVVIGEMSLDGCINIHAFLQQHWAN